MLLLLLIGASGAAASTEALTAGNPTGGLLPITFQPAILTHVPAPFMQEIRGGLHEIRTIEETP